VVVRRLASSAEEQTQYLTELGVAESLDELALEFDDRYRPLLPYLGSLPNGPQVLEECKIVDEALDTETLGWAFDDLNSQEWKQIRVHASNVDALLELSAKDIQEDE
jgi:hypothetical protein